MGPGHIWFDATTIKRLHTGSPVGLSRTEAHVLIGALELDADRVGFCHLNRYSNTLEKVRRAEIEKLLEGYGQFAGQTHTGLTKRRTLVRTVSRELERRIRITARTSLGKLRQRLRWGSRVVVFRPGDLFVLSGATWNLLSPSAMETMLAKDGASLVVLLADMIPWRFPHQFQEAQAVDRFVRFAGLIARKASLVVSISKNTDEDFAEFAASIGVATGRRQVIYLGADPPAPAARQPSGLPADLLLRGYVLSVSTIQVRKNHQLLYMLWRRFAQEGRTTVPRLVLVGAPGWLTADLLWQMNKDPLVRDSLVILHHVSDPELSWLYGHALFTLYPSFYEGWGLPIVESFQHGKPCVASDTSSMPEAGQGLATHLDPMDAMAWRREILRRFEDPSVLEAESERIRTHFRSRSWRDFSNEFAGAVLSVCSSSVK